MKFKNPFPIASRRSPLAMAQSHLVAKQLANAAFASADTISDAEVKQHFPIVSFVSTGDKNLQGSLADIGGKGLFTKEVEEAVLTGEARFAVHSMKDMPVECPDGLVIAAIPLRENPYDAFISDIADSPWELRKGARIGTASVRRRAQILENRPDIVCEVLRGNVNTRLAKLKEGTLDATFLAVAGLNRLNFQHLITKQMDDDTMLPAIGQGALCIQARGDDEEALALAAKIACPITTLCVTLERAFLRGLDGSCKTPIAGLAKLVGDGEDRKVIFKGEYLWDDSDHTARTSIKPDTTKHSVQEELLIGGRLMNDKIGGENNAQLLVEATSIGERLARTIKQKL